MIIVRFLIVTLISLVCTSFVSAQAVQQPIAEDSDNDTNTKLIVVVGAGGEATYQQQFEAWAGRWKSALNDADIETVVIGDTVQEKSDLELLRETLKNTDADTGLKTVWIVLIGHGTFDGNQAKFNLSGPDISGEELSGLLNNDDAKYVVVNCASASGPFINQLVAGNRIIVTSTKSGYEHNFSRFGDFLSQAVADSVTDSTDHDLDKDGQTSLLELTLAASTQTAEFYDTEKRLATEHALIEDNHDGLGTPAEWFRGVRSTKRSKSGNAPDGLAANQLFLTLDASKPMLTVEQIVIRDKLELKLEQLRQKKSSFEENEYFDELETIIIKLAELYR